MCSAALPASSDPGRTIQQHKQHGNSTETVLCSCAPAAFCDMLPLATRSWSAHFRQPSSPDCKRGSCAEYTVARALHTWIQLFMRRSMRAPVARRTCCLCATSVLSCCSALVVRRSQFAAHITYAAVLAGSGLLAVHNIYTVRSLHVSRAFCRRSTLPRDRPSPRRAHISRVRACLLLLAGCPISTCT
jgi:hypothetical protein